MHFNFNIENGNQTNWVNQQRHIPSDTAPRVGVKTILFYPRTENNSVRSILKERRVKVINERRMLAFAPNNNGGTEQPVLTSTISVDPNLQFMSLKEAFDHTLNLCAENKWRDAKLHLGMLIGCYKTIRPYHFITLALIELRLGNHRVALDYCSNLNSELKHIDIYCYYMIMARMSAINGNNDFAICFIKQALAFYDKIGDEFYEELDIKPIQLITIHGSLNYEFQQFKSVRTIL